MTADDLRKLAERCEQASEPSFEPFAEAFEVIHGGRSSMGLKWSSFCALIEAEAWLDAAMILVPKGYVSAVLRDAIDQCFASWLTDTDALFRKRLPLYVCAAALRAQAEEMNK